MKSRFCLGLGLVSALSLGGCIAGDAADSKEPAGEAAEPLCNVLSGTVINRSLVVTDPTILAKFSFKRT